MVMRRTILQGLIALPFLSLSGRAAWAASDEVFNTEGLAIHGYDPVAYFTVAAPVTGDSNYAVQWLGVRWHFASADNMAAFEANPRSYAPQYGGYCAYAMAQGAVATTVPEAWTVHDGRLYLNFSTGVRELWRKDIPGFIESADMHWPAALQS